MSPARVSDPPRIAVVGACGATGRAHVAALRAGGARVAAVVDRDPGVATLGGQVGARAFRDAAALDPDSLDGAVVSLPPRVQPRICARLLTAGLPVLCEKPLATSVRAARPLIESARQPSAPPLLAGFTLRFDTGIRRLRAEIERGRLGRVLAVSLESAHPLPAPGWRLGRGGGTGRIQDAHAYDLVPWLAGAAPVRALAVGGNAFHGGAAEDYLETMLELSGGIAGRIRSAWWPFPFERWRLEVLGTEGLATCEGAELELRDVGGRVEVWRIASGKGRLREEVRAFLDAVRAGAPTPVGLEEGLRALAVSDAVRRSLGTGRPARVRIPEGGAGAPPPASR